MPTRDDGMAGAFRQAYSVLVEQSPSAPRFEELTGSAPARDLDADLDFHRNGDEPARRQPRTRALLALVAASVALLVVGIVASGRDRNDIRSGTAPAAEVAGSRAPEVETGETASEWSLVIHGDTPFDGDDDSGVAAMVAGGPGFVAVGSGGGRAAVWTSVDGREWARVPHDAQVFGGAAETWMTDVTVGGPGLVAVGGEQSCIEVEVLDKNGLPRVDEVARPEPDTECSGVQAVVWTSTDGVEWLRVPHDEAVFGGSKFYRMSAVTRGGPGLVVVGRSEESGPDGLNLEGESVDIDAAVWTSVDGTTWSRVEDPAVLGGERQQEMADVTAGGPGLVAVGREGTGYWWDNSRQDAAVWTSVDGVHWSRVSHDEEVFSIAGEPVMRSIAAGGPGLVAVGWSSPNFSPSPGWTSVDGHTWSVVAPEELAGIDATSVVATAGGHGVVAVGYRENRGGLQTSQVMAVASGDGRTWSEIPLDPSSEPGGNWLPEAVTVDGDRIVGIGFTIERTTEED